MDIFLLLVWSGWRAAITEVLTGLDVVLADTRRRLSRFGFVLVAALAGWVVYVPLHELLHAFGCMASGGEVRELQIQALYGGRLLERLLPFVRAGGDYAGRLTRFDTRGSDLIYLATDFLPFVLTIFGAFPLLRQAGRRRSAVLLGLGLVLCAAPLVSLTGDLYEMGSILVSRALIALPQPHLGGHAMALRHDDLFTLLGQFTSRFSGNRPFWAAAVCASAAAGCVLGNLVLVAGAALAGRMGWPPPGDGLWYTEAKDRVDVHE